MQDGEEVKASLHWFSQFAEAGRKGTSNSDSALPPGLSPERKLSLVPSSRAGASFVLSQNSLMLKPSMKQPFFIAVLGSSSCWEPSPFIAQLGMAISLHPARDCISLRFLDMLSVEGFHFLSVSERVGPA